MTQQSRQDNLHSGITRVGYDANNQPDSVTFSTGESIRYYYDALGNRLGTDEYTAFMPVVCRKEKQRVWPKVMESVKYLLLVR